jgi:hypothetical protein
VHYRLFVCFVDILLKCEYSRSVDDVDCCVSLVHKAQLHLGLFTLILMSATAAVTIIVIILISVNIIP